MDNEKKILIANIQWTGWKTRVDSYGEFAQLVVFLALSTGRCVEHKCEACCFKHVGYYRKVEFHHIGEGSVADKYREKKKKAILNEGRRELVAGLAPMIFNKRWVEERPRNWWQQILVDLWPQGLGKRYADEIILFKGYKFIEVPDLERLEL